MKKSGELSRRRLVQASAAALAAPAFLRAQAPSDEIRVGMIGTGGRGSSLLRRIIKSPGVKVVALCDIDSEALEGAAAIAAEDSPDKIVEFRKLLDRKDIDAVFIATPVNVHKEMAVAALEVHKHLYLEKPMGRTAEDVKAVYQASRTSRGLLQLGFQLRHDPNHRAAVEHIHKGGIGRVAYLQSNRHTNDLPRTKPWFFDASISGNMIVEQAVHIIDIINWVMDGHPVKVYASGGIHVYRDEPPGRTTYDHYIAIFEYPNDIRFAFSHIFFDPAGFTGITERVWGTEAAMDLPSATYYQLEAQGRERAKAQKLEVDQPDADSTQLAVDAFFESVRANKEPLNNAHWGRLATLTAIMGRIAIEQQRIVRWSEVDS